MGSGHKAVFLEIFQKMCRARYFELQLVEAHKKGLIHAPIYLSIGQESIPATASVIFTRLPLIFAQHRAHSTYLSFGGDPVKLRDELLGRETGCCGGRGGSPCIQAPEIGFIPHHGLIGENIPLAVGAALGRGLPVLAFCGDAGYEEDYSLAAIGFAATHKLPVLFICEDNGLSILTPVSMRRSWQIHNIADAMGIYGYSTSDDPFLMYPIMAARAHSLPAYINCHTNRHRWHVGSGIDKEPEQDRLKLFREALLSLGYKKVVPIEKKAKKEMERLWRTTLA